MIIRGRSIYTNGSTASKLTRYLLHNPKNERAVYLGASGTAYPDDLQKSIQQMIWVAEESKSQKAVYFAALSPDLKVDKQLAEEEWEQMRYIQAKHLGLEGQPFAWVEHHKTGRDGQLRIHRHIVYQRYDADSERMISDEYDRRRNALARAEIEETLGHERTFQRWTLEEIKQQEAQRLEQNQQVNLEHQQKAEEHLKREQAIKQQFSLNSDEVARKKADDEYEALMQQYKNKQGWRH